MRAWLIHALDQSARPYFEDGHFYSPVVDPKQARLSAETIWPNFPRPVLGVNFCEERQKNIIANVLKPYLADFGYVDPGKQNGSLYSVDNDQFGGLDARLLFCLMRHYRPNRIVEVGSGYSTLLMCDVNRQFLNDKCLIECVEPYPRNFLLDLHSKIKLHQTPVQQTDVGLFERLRANDFLFIDSSHVAKTGSDVNHLFFEVLPRLAPGVVIHIHDIFLPFEYPVSWVIDERRSWNEQYLLRALLMNSDAYDVVFGAAYAGYYFSEKIKEVFDAAGQEHCGGGSFWLMKR
jgi:predicted O-methyltransferase YrrM